MPSVKKFEDLQCWQNARILVKNVFTLEGRIEKDWDTKRQLQRATLSIMNNIAEGFSRFSDKEFCRFLEIAQSSATECQSMLYVMEDLQYLSKRELQQLTEQLELTKRQILSLMRYLKRSQAKSKH